MAHAHKLT